MEVADLPAVEDQDVSASRPGAVATGLASAATAPSEDAPSEQGLFAPDEAARVPHDEYRVGTAPGK